MQDPENMANYRYSYLGPNAAGFSRIVKLAQNEINAVRNDDNTDKNEK